MEIFVNEQQLISLEQQVEGLHGAARLPLLLDMAWHFCERNTKKAMSLADQVENLALQHQQQISANLQFHIYQRIKLIRAKSALLYADLATANQLAEEVCQACDPAQALLQTGTAQDGTTQTTGPSLLIEELATRDWLCACDAWQILAQICGDRGQTQMRIAHWQRAMQLAQAAHDPMRVTLLEVLIAYRLPRPNRDQISQQFGPGEAQFLASLHPGLASWLGELWGLIYFQEGDFGSAIQIRQCAFDAAISSGQLSRAVISALSIGVSYANLNDHDAALKWKQHGLALAQESGWPGSIGVALVACGETLRMLRQFQAAREVLQQAFIALQAQQSSHNYAIALRNRGYLALDEDDVDLAYQCFSALIERGTVLQVPDFEVSAYRGIAETLSAMGQEQQALQAAQQALMLAELGNYKYEQVEVLMTMAQLYRRHHLPTPISVEGASQAVLHYLQQALQLAESIEGHMISGHLLDSLADAYAGIGDFCSAYQMASRAALAREKTHGIDATNRAISMQVQFQTERSQVERQHHQQLARAEASRVEVLQQTSNTLAHLSAIGQEITAHLEAQAIFQALHHHLQSLLQISAFGVYFIEPERQVLHLRFGMEAGRHLPAADIPLQHPTSYAARCLREGRELMFDLTQHETAIKPLLIVPGTIKSASCIFVPLVVGTRAIGVMSMQSEQSAAFGERECLIFRTLCAYSAIAFDNANAYHQLQQTKAQWVAKEKLAALGSLVAGVAHELNTPLGNSMLMASSLQLKVEQMLSSLAQKEMRHTQLCEFLEDASQAARLVSRSLGTAAALVSSFKQVAVDRTSEQMRDFDLRQTCQEIVATMMNQIRQHGHEFTMDVQEGILLHSYPGPLGQVLGNLINNALQHAFANGKKGQLHLRSGIINRGWVQLRLSDDGCGIVEADMKRIFDPFFAPGVGHGMGGLGLSTSHNIVTTLLRGRLRVESKLGQGSCFIVELPLPKMEA